VSTHGGTGSFDRAADDFSKSFALSVAHIKQQVGGGELYENSVARALVSPDNGAWAELTEIPLEFSGMAGASPKVRFLNDPESLKMLGVMAALTQDAALSDGSSVGLLVLYSRLFSPNRRELFVSETVGNRHSFEPVGELIPGRLPLYIRCRLHVQTDVGQGLMHGTIFWMQLPGDCNLCVVLDHAAAEVHSLSEHPPQGDVH
jgi:hypothetical protein